MTARLTAERLAEIRARAEAATPGPWEPDWERFNDWAFDDALFGAAARTDVPALCDEVAALAKERDGFAAMAKDYALAIEPARREGIAVAAGVQSELRFVLSASDDEGCLEAANRVAGERDALRAELARVAAERDEWREEQTTGALKAENARLREALLELREKMDRYDAWKAGVRLIDTALAPAPERKDGGA